MSHTDPSANGLSYRMILASSLWSFTQEDLKMYTECSTFVLLGLARFTKIFKKTYYFDEIEQLVTKNDGARFVASFLLKISVLLGTGCTLVRLIDPIQEDGSEIELKNEDGTDVPLFRSPVFNVLTMLASIGCIPNVSSHRTIDHKFVMLALQPIKKGTRLISFGKSDFSIFNRKPKSERQSMHYDHYRCSCNCQACTEDWPVALDEIAASEAIIYSESQLHDVKKFLSDLESLISQWDTHTIAHKPNYPDIKTVNKLKSMVAASWKYFSLPSRMMLLSTSLMVTILGSFYDPDKNMFTSSKSAYNMDTQRVVELFHKYRSVPEMV
ncbi:hypothetical protein QAD02_010718 [Eretmocerus hayati]|uniref:Uncharacterized protein n=1 Tax=Eretmocerus hayati TaxID=131215 RepID=A0ACC2NUX5_9HYME|nr:hypothetical protein QAD02_010718 [Eretmocerus hayati]